MAFIFAFGTGSAGRTRALALSAAAALLASAAPPGEVALGVSGQRSAKGLLQVCLTRDPVSFPDCTDDTHAIRRKIPAAQSRLVFDGLPSGSYAIALIHDENSNDRLDTVLGIPREGFGFSRNPPIRFGAPKFASARFPVTSGESATQVTVKYLL